MERVAHSSSTIGVSIPQVVLQDLARVEERLREELASREPRLTTVATHFVGPGGERLRSLMLLLVAHAAANGPLVRRGDAIDVAVALELLHCAARLHDDIVHGTSVRPDTPLAPATSGCAAALVAGDFLFSRAFSLCGRVESIVLQWATVACVTIAESTMLETRARRDPDATPGERLELADRKTATLFGTATGLAAHVAVAEPELVDAMHACGVHAGRVVRLRDDPVAGAWVRTEVEHACAKIAALPTSLYRDALQAIVQRLGTRSAPSVEHPAWV